MWYKLDLSQKSSDERILGRLSTRIAKVLMGKNEPSYDPSKYADNYVVITNAELIEVTGKKEELKEYITHTGYLGSLKRTKYKDKFKKDPTSVLYLAVRGMLPKTKHKKLMMDKLKIYVGPENPHEAQQPLDFPVNI